MWVGLYLEKKTEFGVSDLRGFLETDIIRERGERERVKEERRTMNI